MAAQRKVQELPRSVRAMKKMSFREKKRRSLKLSQLMMTKRLPRMDSPEDVASMRKMGWGFNGSHGEPEDWVPSLKSCYGSSLMLLSSSSSSPSHLKTLGFPMSSLKRRKEEEEEEMNSIQEITRLNEAELASGSHGLQQSWHADYKGNAWIFVGNLDKELAEAGVITIFSQFGEVEAMKLVRDKDSGESRGFGFLKYEDERSTVLAIDNLNGCDISGRTLRVDHADYLPPKKSRDEIALDLRNIMKGIFPRVRTAKEICEGLEDVRTDGPYASETLEKQRHSIPDVTIDRRKQKQSKQRKRKKEKEG